VNIIIDNDIIMSDSSSQFQNYEVSEHLDK
jgi:hypothetical protein